MESSRCYRVQEFLIDADAPRYIGFSNTTPFNRTSQLHQMPGRVPLLQQSSYGAQSPIFSASSIGTASRSSCFTARGTSTSSCSTSIPPLAPMNPHPTLDQQIFAYAFPPPLEFPCEFGFLGCTLRFDSSQFEQWISHELSHFADVVPPSFAICTFCDLVQFRSNGDHHANWRERMIHIAEHFENPELEMGTRSEHMRPDFWVIQYMWTSGLVSRTNYETVMSYSERPEISGLVPLGHKTKEMLAKEDWDLQQQDNMHQEEREWKRHKKNKFRNHKALEDNERL